MIMKNNDSWKYKVKYVQNHAKATTFQITEKIKGTGEYMNYKVLCFSHLDLQDGDEIQFKDYQVEAKIYNQKAQVTLFIKPEDIVVVSLSNSEPTLNISSDDLPF